MATTPNLGLTELTVAQSDKETTVNEGFRWIDVLCQLTVINETNAPPGSPNDGDSHIVTSVPSGDWSGFAVHDIAAYINTAWENRTPEEGWLAYNRATNTFRYFTGAAWATLTTP